MSNGFEQIHTLSRDGVGLTVQLSNEDRLPRLVHWGADPGPVPPGPYGSSALPLLPLQHEGWAGRPALAGDREGRFPHPRLRLTTPVEFTEHAMTVRAADPQAGLEVVCELTLSAQGVIRADYAVTNTGPGIWTLSFLGCFLPVPDEAWNLLEMTGRWALERVPQQRPFHLGAHVRESRRGRTGHDSTTLLCLADGELRNRTGQVWAAHVGWSGNHEHSAVRLPDAQGALGGGELLSSGEIRLDPGASYRTPSVYFAWSGCGLDGIRDRFHRFLRARDTHPRTPRPVVLNTWEAVYFDHRLDKLKALADAAASVGVERFVLDDGWFGARRDDRAGLGDWEVSADVWPDGLGPLVSHVHSLGMQFGLWFEPEMVNPDSELFRAHPDWVLADPGRLPALHRNQLVLDLSLPEVHDYLLARLDALVTEYRIDFIKWDHNRDLVEAPQVHRQTHAAYHLFDALRARHPGLEIESCSSGGARIDLGILERTDRVWTSDTNDPIDRQQIQRWTGLLLPLELIGAHVGPARAHITKRATSIEVRCATALFGHAGIEADLTGFDPAELAVVRDWIELYKRTRGLLHTGRVVTPDGIDPAASVHGVVAQDGSHALFSYAQLDSALPQTPMRLRIPGLLPQARYNVATVLGPEHDGAVSITGRALETVGLPLPRLKPAEVLVLEFTS
ncbi:alpha-galactosidase [Rhizocola hellebori]|uniref:Alpha-galactosidase n=1 Tax=Rhizocola hellebori TaxID=1392758 RepID=A0A8J3Q7M9_9ACTN|nr:alpha-galactosidase [Rhizocola hellebori]GIH04731.1 alpha-galactosidase [Rhizocola hellebori]